MAFYLAPFGRDWILAVVVTEAPPRHFVLADCTDNIQQFRLVGMLYMWQRASSGAKSMYEVYAAYEVQDSN
jgi:hypothetical protein